MVTLIAGFFFGLLALLTALFLMAFAIMAWPALAALFLWLTYREHVKRGKAPASMGC